MRPTSLIGAVATDRGLIRPTNQDVIALVCPSDPADRERNGVLLVVADGMGGPAGGEIASRIAVETVTGSYASDNHDPGAALVRAVHAANAAIYREGIRNPHYLGMGTTCTAVLIRQGYAHCAHIGDSRLYLIRDGIALQMTDDHNAVFDQVKRGTLDRETARHHPDRHLLVRALGTRATTRIDAWPQPLFVRFDDRFVVSSDGLHDLISDDDMTATVLSASPDTACQRLVEMALARGGPDNVSVGVIHINR